jgi:hypothetical protein
VFGGSTLRGAAKKVETENTEVADVADIESAAQRNQGVITRREVLKALDDWAQGIVAISDAKLNNEDYVNVATNVIHKSYNYDNGIVLFKPTLAAEVPFRTTFESALSYFVGGNPAYPEDTGFALKNWKSVSFNLVGLVSDRNRAVIQTTTTFTNRDDAVTQTYFSMVFARVKDGSLKLELHHSSLPPAAH